MALSFTKTSRQKRVVKVLLVFALAIIAVVIAVYLRQMREGYNANLRARRLLQLSQNTTASGRVLQDIEGFSIIGRLDISAIGVSLPVIGECTKTALSTSVCRLSGPTPGNAGHLILLAHEFWDGSHFGKLKKLVIGDSVQVMDVYGNVYYYEVYEIVSIHSDNQQALTVCSGERGLSLMTTADTTNRCLLVRCREKAVQ